MKFADSYDSGNNRDWKFAECIVIDTSREIARRFGDNDPTTGRVLEGILAQAEEHADELADLLQKNQF